MKTFTLNKKISRHLQASAIWALLDAAYQHVEGGLHFHDIQELLGSTVRWHVVFHQNRPIAVTIFKAKKGLKLVALATCQSVKALAKQALQRIIIEDLPHVWMEVSENAERFIFNHCRGEQFLIPSEQIPALLGKQPEGFAADGYHYVRTIQNIAKTKVALGTPSI